VVSGITMSFQFGTNWPGFMERVGNIAGPLLGYEVLTAFFLEATFLGVMLFGHGKVSERVHLLATFLVAFGTTMSAFWILALNSWMHTPAGHEIRNGEFFVKLLARGDLQPRRSPTAWCTCCWPRADGGLRAGRRQCLAAAQRQGQSLDAARCAPG
jgi:cytochrome bd-type quinol oxidase subunit 1